MQAAAAPYGSRHAQAFLPLAGMPVYRSYRDGVFARCSPTLPFLCASRRNTTLCGRIAYRVRREVMHGLRRRSEQVRTVRNSLLKLWSRVIYILVHDAVRPSRYAGSHRARYGRRSGKRRVYPCYSSVDSFRRIARTEVSTKSTVRRSGRT